MEVQLLKNILTKLKANELFQALSRWSFLTNADVLKLKSTCSDKTVKRVLSNNIAEFCMEKGGLRMEKVGDLELIYTQMYSVKRTWSAYHLIERQGSALESQKNFTPENMKRDLNKLLRLYFRAPTTASVMLHNGLLWGRVYLPRPGYKQYQSTRCVYFVYYPRTPVIIMSGVKSEATFGVFMSKCLLFVLGCKDSEDLSLTGHHLESLAELAINKFAAGGYNRFQLTQRPGGPAGVVQSRKRKVPEVEEHERVICEYMAEKRQRLEDLDNTFGTTVLPTLERVLYKVELPYKGKIVYPELQDQDDLFRSRVQFQGKSVLEGIRNLGAAGYAVVPLQKHLTCIPSRARNCFLLARKQQTGDVSQQRKTTETGREENRTATSPHRMDNRTATLQSPHRVGNRTATLQSPHRSGNRTATLQSPHRAGNRTATLQSPHRAGNRTATLQSPQRTGNRTATPQSMHRASGRATPLTTERSRHRAAIMISPQQRPGHRTARGNKSKQQTVRETQKSPVKQNKARNKQQQKKTCDINKKVLRENQSLNSSVDSDTFIRGKTSGTGLRERSNVPDNISPTNIVPKHWKQKAKR